MDQGFTYSDMELTIRMVQQNVQFASLWCMLDNDIAHGTVLTLNDWCIAMANGFESFRASLEQNSSHGVEISTPGDIL